MASLAGSLRLGRAQGADRFFLLDRPVSGGDVVQMCASGAFYFSIELDGGGVAQLHLPIPDRALLRWP
jgi:hypothetical protein